MTSFSKGESRHHIQCEACGCEGEAHVEGIMDLSDALPRHWKRRIINNQAYILCDVCGHPHHFTSGLSAYLRDRLNLPDNATFDIPERGDFLVSGKIQRKSSGDTTPDFSRAKARPRRHNK